MFRVGQGKLAGRMIRPRHMALASAVLGGALVLAILYGAEQGRSVMADDCLQRVKVWSPSRQSHVLLVQNFCG